jgi:hypothetical protein
MTSYGLEAEDQSAQDYRIFRDITGGLTTQRQKTSVAGYEIRIKAWTCNFSIILIDSGDDMDDINVELPSANQRVEYDLCCFVSVSNQTAFTRNIVFSPASGESINDEAVDATVTKVVDASNGPEDHNRKVFLLFGSRAGYSHVANPHVHIYEFQQNPGALVSLATAGTVDSQSLVVDGIGPDMTIKGIRASATTVDPALAGLISLSVTTNGSNEIVIALSQAS